MNHLYEFREGGYSCLMCGAGGSYDYSPLPDKCPIEGCGKPFIKQFARPSEFSNFYIDLVAECEDGHQYFVNSYPEQSECPKGKIIVDLFRARNLLPYETWQIDTPEKWRQFGDTLADFILKALKVDRLFPDGLQHMADRLASIKE